jgi:N utilization substance protein B
MPRKKRRLLRQEVMEILYQHRLLEKDIMLLSETYGLDEHDPDGYFVLTLLEFIHINEEALIEKIRSYLKEWEFERLPHIDQAILILGCAELERGQTDRAVVIDEAIELTKLFSDEEAFKYINAILDAYG